MSLRRTWWNTFVLMLALAGGAWAQAGVWKLGGAGLAWGAHDSLTVLVDFEGTQGGLQPRYLGPGENVLHLLDNWQFLRDPSERTLAYVPGQMPRIWKGGNGAGGDPSQSGVFYIDADSTTYNAPSSQSPASNFFTIDLAVPVPAARFGFFTPPTGFRADGTPLRLDATPAFDVSIGDDLEPAVQIPGSSPLSQSVAAVAENLDPVIHVDFPPQYVRYIRWRRRESILDAEALQRCTDCGGAQGNQALALKGSIGGFEVFAEGVPRRAVYLSSIVDLGRELNFGRLHWTSTPLRRVGGVEVAAPEAAVGIKVEVRTGRDVDPAVYHEFTNTGREGVVPRARYEELKPRQGRDPKPGVRASVGYDSDNWTFWSVPFRQSGRPLGLRSGSHLQITLTLESDEFDAWVRLDSLWIETAPLLAATVVGEVARLDDPRPERGFTEVALGESADFAYDLAAVFEGAAAPGFDALRIRTGGRARFQRLEMGQPPVVVEPASFSEGEEALVIHLPQAITPANNQPVRVVFGAEVFEYAATFNAEVFIRDGDDFAQPVVPGDAGEALSTNSLSILSRPNGVSGALQQLAFSTPVLTPNGDGVHDRLEVSYALFRLPEPVPVSLEVRSLDGRLVAHVPAGSQAAGPQRIDWDGRDGRGLLLAPGLYLVSVALDAEAASSRQTRVLGVSY
jgi:hypothetical protein